MKITVRGWNRDMGETVIADHPLQAVEYRYDDTRAYYNKPVLYWQSSVAPMTVAWFQPMKLTGNYRMEIRFTRDDVMQLFKYFFLYGGSQIDLDLVEEYGLTLSPELVKSILKKVKLPDLTLGDLMAMSAKKPEKPATADKLVEAAKVPKPSSPSKESLLDIDL